MDSSIIISPNQSTISKKEKRINTKIISEFFLWRKLVYRTEISVTIFIDDSYENEWVTCVESSAGKDFAIGGLQWSMANEDRDNAVIKWIWTVLESVSETDQSRNNTKHALYRSQSSISPYSLQEHHMQRKDKL